MDILERLLQHADQAEVMTTESETTTVRFQANQPKGSEVEETRGIALRVIKDGRLGFAATSDMTEVEKTIKNAVASAAFGDEVGIEFPDAQPGPEVKTYDGTIVELPVRKLVDIGREIIALITETDSDALVDVRLERGVERRIVRNHAGADVDVARTPFSLLIEVTRVKGDDVLIMFNLSGSTVWEEDALTSARQLAERLRLAQRTATMVSGKMPVLFSPTGALVLGLPLMVGLNGRNVYKGVSPLADRLGEHLVDDAFSLIDDPTLDGRFGSASHDGEGVAHRRTPLIENGTLKSFYYDLKTAAQAGAEPTGNGERSLFSPPRPSPTNLVVEPGATSIADIIAGIERGLLVDNVLGLGQGNVISGAFSNPVSLGFKIENGEIVGRVKDLSIAGNIYEVLGTIAAISKESAWVYNNFRLPYILLPELNVVAKTQ
ncbi:MAG: TldD/PmbA family protein [Anaerolineae bacterium]